MIKLSVNINKIATLRNARGGNMPNVIDAARNTERYGADSITVHPRPDGRHIRYEDVRELKIMLETELNIEGYPSIEFVNLVMEVMPTQVTLVPDKPDTLTSNAGWDTIKHRKLLTELITEFKRKNIRTSIFVEPNREIIEAAALTGTERIELYTENYAFNYAQNKNKAIEPFILAAKIAQSIGVGVNAGHDLSLENLKYFAQQIPNLLEVSIGHAIICDALYLGLENTIQLYKRCLTK